MLVHVTGGIVISSGGIVISSGPTPQGRVGREGTVVYYHRFWCTTRHGEGHFMECCTQLSSW